MIDSAMLQTSTAHAFAAPADILEQTTHPVSPCMGRTFGVTQLKKLDRQPVEPNRICRVAFLDASAVDAIKSNHDIVLQDLPPEFMYPKSREFFLDLFACDPSNTIVGVIDGSLLAAKSTITSHNAERPYGWSEGYTPTMRDDQLCVIGGVTVLPSYRGNDFMRSMVQGWKQHALDVKKDWLLAEIDVKNIYSLENFLVEGLHVVGIAIDKSDGGINHIVARRTEEANQQLIIDPLLAHTVHVQNVDAQRQLLQEGYVGVACDLAAKTITYIPNPSI